MIAKSNKLTALLTAALILTLAACSAPPAETQPVSSEQTEADNPYGFPPAAEEGEAVWPDAEGWAAMGLPDLSLKELTGISVRRSEGSGNEDFYCYESVLFTCQPKYNTRFSVLTERLDKAGLEGEIVRDDIDWKIYQGTYEFAGEKMAIEVREDGIGRLYITVMGHAAKMTNSQ